MHLHLCVVLLHEIILQFHGSFIEKTSVMQDPNLKCVQNFR